MWRRQERRRAKLNEAILDGLAEEFDNELAGVEYPVTPELSDRQLASALTLPGMVLASAVVELPPVVGEHHKSEAKRLQKAADDHPERVVALARFLAHAIITYSITHDEVVTDLSDRLQREPSPQRRFRSAPAALWKSICPSMRPLRMRSSGLSAASMV
jgi:hypothetical protein